MLCRSEELVEDPGSDSSEDERPNRNTGKLSLLPEVLSLTGGDWF